jgi:lysyl-tRNA synthetase class 2
MDARRRLAVAARMWRGLVAAVVALPGGLTLLAALTPVCPWHGSLALTAPPHMEMGFTRMLTAAVGLALLVLARALLQGKRRAADALVGLLCTVAIVRFARGVDGDLTLVVAGLAALVYASRAAFPRGADARPARRAGTVALSSVLGAYLAVTAATLLTAHARGLGSALAAAAAGRLQEVALNAETPLGMGLDFLALVGLVSGAVFVRELLRPAPGSDGHSPADHALAARVVARHGEDSLAPFALREDKAYHFADGGLLAYRTLRETAVVSGDPIGPPGSAPAILADFRGLAVRRGWDVVVTAAGEEHLDAYRELGLRAIHIGNEAVVDPQRFSLEGRAIRKVRQSVSRVARHGWTIEVVLDRDLDAATVRCLDGVERAWRSNRPRIQGWAMTLGRLWGAAGDVGGVYVLARDPGGRLQAFLRFVEHGRGLSLDCMRRLGDEPNGVNEAMVVAALEHARERGCAEVSLNFAGFAHIMAASAALSRRQRLLRAALRAVHGRFQLERLVRFNEKFFPTWRPRYLVYGRRTHLPLAALRVLQAEAYLRPPRARPLSAGWKPAPAPAAPAAIVRPEASR